MDRLRTLRSLTALCAASAVLAACGGGSHSAMLPASGGSAGTGSGKSVASENATFQFTVPKTVTSALRTAGTRTPRYVSAATKSIQLTLNSASATSPAPAPVTTQVLNVPNGTGSAPGAPCTPSGPNYICTMTVKLPIGNDAVTITSYDANNGGAGGGNVLSQQKVTETIVQGVANGPGGAFSIVLDANAATMTVNGSGSCQNGPIGSAFGSVGTTPVTFTVAYTDAATKTIVTPGLPKLSVTATGVTGGTIGVSVNQAAQTYTLTPSTSSVSGTINVQAVQADSTGSSDGLSFTKTKSYTFATGNAPLPSFLAAVEQIGAGSGEIDLYNITLGSGGAMDSFSQPSQTTLAVTNSTNEGKPDVDNPVDATFDVNGDLLIANFGTTTGGDYGNLACVPAGAIVTPANTSTTVETNFDSPTALAYDSRDGSVALANNPNGASSNGYDFIEFLLTGNYTAAPVSRDIHNTLADDAVVNLPALPAGSYAAALPGAGDTHNGGPVSKVAIVTPGGGETDISSSSDTSIDRPTSLAWDAQNQQLVVANNSPFCPYAGDDIAFYTVSPSITKVKTINPGVATSGSFCPDYSVVAASPDGHIAAVYFSYTPEFQIQVYDNTSARNPVGGPIPFNGTDNSANKNYIYDTGNVNVTGPGGTEKVYVMRWLSNTKLMIGFGTQAPGKQGYYIYDISTMAVPPGLDDNSGAAFAAAPKQTGFLATSKTPISFAYKP